MAAHRLPPAIRNPEDAPFWGAAAEGRFLLRRCRDCERTHWYPRPICPFCQGDTAWEESDGRGTIYTFTVMPKSQQEPIGIGYLELADGLRIYGGLLPDELDRIAIDAPAVVAFVRASDETPVPIFRLLHEEEETSMRKTNEA